MMVACAPPVYINGFCGVSVPAAMDGRWRKIAVYVKHPTHDAAGADLSGAGWVLGFGVLGFGFGVRPRGCAGVWNNLKYQSIDPDMFEVANCDLKQS